MTTQKTVTRRPILRATEAQLYVADVTTSCAFFTSKLGFEIAFLHGDPPFYGQVHRDNARLNLRMVSEPVFAGDIREREQLLSASIAVGTASEMKHLAHDFESAGVRFHQKLKTEPWGATTFVVADPDGNLILFAGPADASD
jgi:catechol 2,3-dioxygenase-like lactoylglutathione lyase family enzyme